MSLARCRREQYDGWCLPITAGLGKGEVSTDRKPPNWPSPSGDEAQVLAELLTRLQAHSQSLQRDIRRLQGALSDIHGAMATSLDRAERLRLASERLRTAFRTSRGACSPPPTGNVISLAEFRAARERLTRSRS